MKRVNLRGQVEHVAYVRSNTRPGTEYQIGHRGGRMACACMGYVFSKATPKTCAHLDALGVDRRSDSVQVRETDTERQATVRVGRETFTYTTSRRAITFGEVPR